MREKYFYFFTRRVGNQILLYSLILHSLAVPLAWVLSSYFKIDIPASLLFYGDDGWCNPATEGFGIHCFGDFNERFLLRDMSLSPSGNNLELSPIGPFFTSIANFGSAHTSPRFILTIVSSLYAACALSPLFLASNRRFSIKWAMMFLICGVGSYPFLATMDRLNNIALCVPFLWLFLASLSRGAYRAAAFSIITLAMVKPQFLLLSFVFFFVEKHYKLAVATLLAGFFAVFLLVVVAGGFDYHRINQYFSYIFSYSAGSNGAYSFGDLFPPNYSFASALWLPVNFLVKNHFTVLSLDSFRSVFSTVSSKVLLVILLFSLLAKRKLVNVLDGGIILILIASLGSASYVAGYYTVSLVPVVSLLLYRARSSSIDLIAPRCTINSKFLEFARVLVSLGAAFAISPIVIPKLRISDGSMILGSLSRIATMTPYLSSLLLLIGICIYLVVLCRSENSCSVYQARR